MQKSSVGSPKTHDTGWSSATRSYVPWPSHCGSAHKPQLRPVAACGGLGARVAVLARRRRERCSAIGLKGPCCEIRGRGGSVQLAKAQGRCGVGVGGGGGACGVSAMGSLAPPVSVVVGVARALLRSMRRRRLWMLEAASEASRHVSTAIGASTLDGPQDPPLELLCKMASAT